MNKKNKKNEISGGLSFKRETVRSLTADEVRQAAGGMKCEESCQGPTCARSMCNITKVGGEDQ